VSIITEKSYRKSNLGLNVLFGTHRPHWRAMLVSGSLGHNRDRCSVVTAGRGPYATYVTGLIRGVRGSTTATEFSPVFQRTSSVCSLTSTLRRHGTPRQLRLHWPSVACRTTGDSTGLRPPYLSGDFHTASDMIPPQSMYGLPPRPTWLWPRHRRRSRGNRVIDLRITSFFRVN